MQRSRKCSEPTLYTFANEQGSDFNLLFNSINEFKLCSDTELIKEEVGDILTASNKMVKNTKLTAQISTGNRLTQGKEVYVCGSRGIDAYTRNKMKKALLQFMQPFDIDFLIERLLAVEINLLCMRNKQRVSVKQAALNLLELLKHPNSFTLLSEQRALFHTNCKEQYKYTGEVPELTVIVFYSFLAGLNTLTVSEDRFPLHSKGLGTFYIGKEKIKKGQYIDDYLGMLYPMWRWFEREENMKVIRSRLAVKETQPNFYNMVLERLKGDEDGFNAVMVSPSNNANFTSRISHSCNPNLKVKNICIDGQYRLVVKAIKDIEQFEELCFDYNCRSDNLEEVKKALCFCNGAFCRGSYIFFFDDGFSDFYLLKHHPLIQRFKILVKAIGLANDQITKSLKNYEENKEGDKSDEVLEIEEILKKYKFGKSLLDKLPLWLVYFVGLILKFIKNSAPILEDQISDYRKLFPLKLKEEKLTEKEDKFAIKADGQFVMDKYVNSCSVFAGRAKYFLKYQSEHVKHSSPVVKATDEEIIQYYQTIINKIRDFVRVSSDSKTNFNLVSRLEDVQTDLTNSKDLSAIRKSINKFCTFLNTQRPRRKKSFNVVTDLLFLKINTKNFYKITQFRGFISEFGDVGVAKGKTIRDTIVHRKYDPSFLLVYCMYWFKDTTENNLSYFDFYKKGVLQLPMIDSYTEDKFTSKHDYINHRNDMVVCMEEGREWPYNDQVGFIDDDFIGSPLLDLECGDINKNDYDNIIRKFKNLVGNKKV
eukprot:GAHX01000525.1.p1 GENE.GAHX01000525.1~~GAHX01000525.1.p1  ORF type:complete len:762 (+),score=166.43 GAHX01000525.1:43-2328(+)